jgi:Fe(3+) dicitrate transport protein
MSFIDSRYTDFETLHNGTPNAVITSSNLNGKGVENAPRYIHNLGLSWGKTTYQLRCNTA